MTNASKLMKTLALAMASLVLAAVAMLGVSQMAYADDEATDEVVFTVYSAPYPGADTVVVKEFTADEFAEINITHDTATYASYNGTVRAAYTYATTTDILTAAGLTFDSSSTITYTASADNFSATFDYETWCGNQYFYSEYTYGGDLGEALSGYEVCIADTYGAASDTSGTYTFAELAEQALDAAYEHDEFQLLVPQNSSNSNAGRVQVGGVDSITISSAFGRVAGTNRYETMAEIVAAAFLDGMTYSTNIVVTTGSNYPDALAAAGYAGLDLSFGKYTYATPIVITKTNELTDAAYDTIYDVIYNSAVWYGTSGYDGTITIVGGTGAVSEDVEAAIETLAADIVADVKADYSDLADTEITVSVERIAGGNRIETAIEVFEAGSDWDTTAYLVSSQNYADALSASAAAYYNGSAILLADKNGDVSDELEEVLTAAQADGTITNIIILGGTNAVSADAEETVASIFGSDYVTRVAGANRYETSSEFADYAVANLGLSYSTVVVATGTDFADALTASPIAGINAAAVLLVADTDNGSACITTNIAENAADITQGFVIGGTGAVSADTYSWIYSLIY